jgi:hypothetical protein
MIVKQAIAGTKGFDVNGQLFPNEYAAFKNAGYDFAIRYIPRTAALATGNLTAVEVQAILSENLALSAVQHCAMPGWSPTAEMGMEYGLFAAQYAKSIGLPFDLTVGAPKMTIWLDLEGSTTATPEDIIDYCHQWFGQVGSYGYEAGLYCGYGTGLTDQQLYDLPFARYWRAYNSDQSIPTRGYCMEQQTQKSLNGIAFDPDIIKLDAKGGLPMLLFNS